MPVFRARPGFDGLLQPGTAADLFKNPRSGRYRSIAILWSGVARGFGRISGTGSATVRGVFDSETFSVSPGGTRTFAPTHQYHLGLWFNSPKVPFSLGCEPGATSPIVTPFNGNQHAGIRVLNTAQFSVDAGPLSQVHR